MQSRETKSGQSATRIELQFQVKFYMGLGSFLFPQQNDAIASVSTKRRWRCARECGLVCVVSLNKLALFSESFARKQLGVYRVLVSSFHHPGIRVHLL